MIKTEQDIIQLIKEDEWMMELLHTANHLNLPDWWICAGFVRSKVWDELHSFSSRTKLGDVDVIYFDPSNQDEKTEKRLEKRLLACKPSVPWSVKNQARMHLLNDVPPYSSSIDAIAHFPETATALGVKIDEQGELLLAAPHGIHDVLNGVMKPTDLFKPESKRAHIFHQRVIEKNWQQTWPKLTLHTGREIQ